MFGSIFRQGKPAAKPPASTMRPDTPSVLNVGGNSKDIPIPPHYQGWQHLLLDIDARRDVDVVCDARELGEFEAARFDAIYCSHNLEHYYAHDVPRVLAGFLHVLKPDGFAEIRVPDLEAVIRKLAGGELGLEDELYDSPAGPITALDVIYGYGKEIESSGEDFYAHKTGFSAQTLNSTLQRAGFQEVWKAPPLSDYEIRALAFRQPATPKQRTSLGIPLNALAG
jgi:SAM-dependent methyltransferase